MEPIIYTLSDILKNQTQETESESEKTTKVELNFYFDNQPSPKLIKYGFNNINEQIDLIALTSVPYYKAGLNFNFEGNADKSISVKASNLFKTKKFNQDFAEFWEILNLFGIITTNQNIYTSHPDTLKEIISSYQKLTKSKNTLSVMETPSKGKATTVIYKYSSIEIDENALIQFLINTLPNLLTTQAKGSNMIIQLFALQTQTSAEIIYYLSTLYNEAYLIKPIVSSDLSDSKYLILLGLKTPTSFNVPKHSENIYLISIGLQSLADNLSMVIQCMNSDIIPKKYNRYNQIKVYLDSKVYEGATYQEMLERQHKNTEKWLELYGPESVSNIDKMKSFLDQTLAKSSSKCATHAELINLLSQ